MFLDDQLRPRVAGPQGFPVLGFPSVYAYTLCRRTTKFDVVTCAGFEARVSWGQPRLPSQESGDSALHSFGNDYTPFNTQNDQI